jgi:hypothetical protein
MKSKSHFQDPDYPNPKEPSNSHGTTPTEHPKVTYRSATPFEIASYDGGQTTDPVFTSDRAPPTRTDRGFLHWCGYCPISFQAVRELRHHILRKHSS